MKSRLLVVVMAACLLAAVSVSAGAQASGAPYRNVDPSELAKMLAHKDFFFVNVHVPYQGEIASTDAFIPFDRTRELIGEYPADRKAKIVLYCRSGRMSDIAARQLAAAGYTNLYNLAGGMVAWQNAGLPVEVNEPAEGE